MKEKERINLVRSYGFARHPFEIIRADKELGFIERCFIIPPYFDKLLGNPLDPSASIVYGPKGSGKTSHRVMIESRIKDYDSVISISYTDHDLEEGLSDIKDIDLAYHLKRINELLIIAFLDRVKKSNIKYNKKFTLHQRQNLYDLIYQYLRKSNKESYSDVIKSFKTSKDLSVLFWKRFRHPLTSLIEALARLKGLDIRLSSNIESKPLSSIKDDFFTLKKYFKLIGINSIFILIDQIDEARETLNDAQSSYHYIAPLIEGLKFLETEGLGFKFFLWDKIKIYASKKNRLDRIKSFELKWDFDSLMRMINKRVKTYSNEKYRDATSLFAKDEDQMLGRIILFSQFSPRDVMNIFDLAFAELLEARNEYLKISREMVNKAIDRFCQTKFNELLEESYVHANMITKLNSVCFNINNLSSSMSSYDSAIHELMNKLLASNLVVPISRNQNNEYSYAFNDIRLARVASGYNLEKFINLKVRDCQNSNCKTFAFRDFDSFSFNCLGCGQELTHRPIDKSQIKNHTADLLSFSSFIGNYRSDSGLDDMDDTQDRESGEDGRHKIK